MKGLTLTEKQRIGIEAARDAFEKRISKIAEQEEELFGGQPSTVNASNDRTGESVKGKIPAIGELELARRKDRLSGLAESARRIADAVQDGFQTEQHRTPSESRAWGKSLRKDCPRSSHAVWRAPADRENPIELLREQASERVADLVPIRYERMAASPFAYFRGCALPMASDLSHTPVTGIHVQACGDAHVANFGIFATPERRLAFDLNDFDETLPGPWEWDIKRLAASLEICGRDRGFSADQRQKATLAAVQTYRETMRSFAERGNLDVWYAYADVDRIMESGDFAHKVKGNKVVRQTLSEAHDKNSSRAVRKFTEVVDGKLRVKSDPPIVVPLRDLGKVQPLGLGDGVAESHIINRVIDGYRMSLPRERQKLIDRYHGVDMAHKVVGVGSVGLRAWIIVMEGADSSDPLVLQAKEARASVLERYVGKSRYLEHGRRVVEGQRAMQSCSDIFLGWTRQIDDSGKPRDYYVRQLWDSKGSIDLETISPSSFTVLASSCGWALAHAHARTGNRFAIAGYLGSSDTFDQALASFANAYADQNEADYEAFLEARRNGRI
jgi:uncharacterized protein (DUF2252 family)